jgi:hypothetical protein
VTPATVVWWETGRHDEVSAWLVVGPGSPPFTEQAWVTQVAVAGGEPAAWAVASNVPLWELGPELASSLRDPTGPDRPGLHSLAFARDGSAIAGPASAELYDACRTAAFKLVAGRAQNEFVVREPRTSGIVLLRLRIHDDALALDLAPAIDEPAWRGRPIDVDLDSIGPVLEGEPTFGTETMAVMGREATLPCAHVRFAGAPAGREATVRLTLPKPWLPGAPDPIVNLLLHAGDDDNR